LAVTVPVTAEVPDKETDQFPDCTALTVGVAAKFGKDAKDTGWVIW
jgi:hypothetical protein